MPLSARNQLKGTVSEVNTGVTTAQVTVDIGNGNKVVSLITKAAVDDLAIKPGDHVTAIIKATEVLILK